jgi:hypothetical protein
MKTAVIINQKFNTPFCTQLTPGMGWLNPPYSIIE